MLAALWQTEIRIEAMKTKAVRSIASQVRSKFLKNIGRREKGDNESGLGSKRIIRIKAVLKTGSKMT